MVWFLPGHGNNSAAGYIAYDLNNNEPVGVFAILIKMIILIYFINRDGH